MKKNKKAGKEMTVVGFVREIEDDDDVLGLEISTDEDDYVVELNKEGKKLFDLVDRDIEATGIVTEDEDGLARITISSFEVLETEDDYDDEDDDRFLDDRYDDD